MQSIEEVAGETSNSRFRSMIEQAPVAIALTAGPDLIFQTINAHMLKIIGRKTNTEVLGKKLVEVLPELRNQPIYDFLLNVLNTGEIFTGIEVQAQLMTDGVLKTRYFNITYSRFVESDAVTSVMHIATDVTDQVLARSKVEESERELKRFKFMADNAEDAFILMREDGTFAYLNKKALDAWGYTAEEALLIRVPDVDPIYNEQKFSETFAKAQIETIPQFETLHKRKDGYIYPVEVKMGGLNFGGERLMFAVARDITDRKRTEEALRISEDRLQKTFLIETVGVIYFDIEGTIHDANPAFEKMSGYSRDEFQKGKVRWDVLTAPEFFNVTMKARDEFLTQGQNTPYEKQYIRADGSRWWGLFAGKRLSDKECVEFVIDITPIKQVEEELEKRVEERTIDLQWVNNELTSSNQNLEQFAYAASHDLKEPLRKILLFVDRLKRTLKDRLTDEETKYFQRIDNSVLRMNTLIEDLLSYSHVSIQPRNFISVNLNELIDEILSDFDFLIEETMATIKVENLGKINGHSRQLQQAFHNLIGNALKYSKDGIPPEIEISYSRVSHDSVTINKERLELNRDYHCIQVKDKGIGFEQNDADRIFDVFTRLHQSNYYKGTGVGLSIVRKVVENHDGFVIAEGSPGNGAAFKLFFPV